jgi:hypothetical protein
MFLPVSKENKTDFGEADFKTLFIADVKACRSSFTL